MKNCNIIGNGSNLILLIIFQALEDLTIQKTVMKERFERELASLKSSRDENEAKFKEEHEKELTEKLRRLEQEKKEETNRLEEEMKKMKMVSCLR